MLGASSIAARRTTMSYTLAEAAKACGVNKSTVKLALKAGRLSGTKDDRGIWRVEAADLDRAFPRGASAAASTEALPCHAPPDAVTNALMPGLPSSDRIDLDDAELRRRASLAEQRLYDRITDLQDAIVDMRRDRDAWREQAERMNSPAPRRSWWRRLRSTG
jgi:excisionase family DNA binding protein